jgi:preprotein translocase subunit SecD
MKSSIKSRLLVLIGIIVASVILLVPTFFPTQFENWPFSKPLSLGLDLSGGIAITYEVQEADAVVSYVETLGREIRKILLEEKIPVVRAKAEKDGRLGITFLSKESAEKGFVKIEDSYPLLNKIAQEDIIGGRVQYFFEVVEAKAIEIKQRAVEQAIEALRNRVDQFGVAEPLIQRIGKNRISLQMPGFSDIDKVKRVIGKVAKLEFRLTPDRPNVPSVTLKDLQGGKVKVEDRIQMSGDKVEDAKVSVGAGRVEVTLKLTRDGGKLFRDITTDNVGRNLAIILDNIVYSSPSIREPISGGEAIISGSFTVEEAQQLSVILKSGALPATLKVLEEKKVGPSLGSESIKSGVLAICGGFVSILLFMAWYYRGAGLIAVGTLVINLLVLLATLSLFGATLTLPGLAGLALTIGIAVDSNVIIFERIRDELRNGYDIHAAITAGFDNALSAILDTNLTALVTGVILYFFGTGPIRGFAVTLSIGVLTTIFAAVFVAKIVFDVLDDKGKPIKF